MKSAIDTAIELIERGGGRQPRFDAELTQAICSDAISRVDERRSLSGSFPEPRFHRLGFLRIPLTKWNPSAIRVALHIWHCPSVDRYQEDIHDHCYDFLSVCLIGGIRHSIYDLPRAPNTGLQFERLAYKTGSSECTVTDRANGELCLVNEIVVRPLESVYFDSSVLHSLKPETAITASVQFRTADRKVCATVYRSSEAPATASLSRAATGAEVDRYINLLKARLN